MDALSAELKPLFRFSDDSTHSQFDMPCADVIEKTKSLSLGLYLRIEGKQGFFWSLENMLLDGPANSCIVAIYDKSGWYDTSSRWVIGTVLMEAYYTVFDLDNMQIGFSPSTWWEPYGPKVPDQPEEPEEEE
jgi:hypothetical protein